MAEAITLALDAMGGDAGPEAIVEGAAIALRRGVAARFVITGDAERLIPMVEAHSALAAVCEVRHAEGVVRMDEKPGQALRNGRATSMWAAIKAVKDREAQACVSAGNTGALMAMSKVQLRMIEGVDRPAIAAIWPTERGRTVVLDVGANVEADAKQLVEFSIMGEAFFRAISSTKRPRVGLLNVGAEELKGHNVIRGAAQILREADPEMDFRGFVEGDDISGGAVDVVVTDGFSGNIALKTAEGTARMLAGFMRNAFTKSILSKVGALIMSSGLAELKHKMDPNRVNGGVFLGLKGVVVKSHGSASAEGVASAIQMAEGLARSPFMDEIESTVARVLSGVSNDADGDSQNVREAAVS